MKIENLNAEQIKYCLELILKSGIGMSHDDVDVTDIKRALALITSQEQRIKELTEENKAWQMQLISTEEKANKAYYDLACEVEDLRKENEKLHASCTELTQKMQDNVRAENEELRKSSECDVRKLKTDTVRKMQEALEQRIHNKLSYHGWFLKETVIAEIAKEMLEGL